MTVRGIPIFLPQYHLLLLRLLLPFLSRPRPLPICQSLGAVVPHIPLFLTIRAWKVLARWLPIRSSANATQQAWRVWFIVITNSTHSFAIAGLAFVASFTFFPTAHIFGLVFCCCNKRLGQAPFFAICARGVRARSLSMWSLTITAPHGAPGLFFLSGFLREAE